MLTSAAPGQLAQLWRALGQPTRPVPSTSVLRNLITGAKSALSRHFPEGTFMAAYPTLSAICESLHQLLCCNHRHVSPVITITSTLTITSITIITGITIASVSVCVAITLASHPSSPPSSYLASPPHSSPHTVLSYRPALHSPSTPPHTPVTVCPYNTCAAITPFSLPTIRTY